MQARQEARELELRLRQQGQRPTPPDRGLALSKDGPHVPIQPRYAPQDLQREGRGAQAEKGVEGRDHGTGGEVAQDGKKQKVWSREGAEREGAQRGREVGHRKRKGGNLHLYIYVCVFVFFLC